MEKEKDLRARFLAMEQDRPGRNGFQGFESQKLSSSEPSCSGRFEIKTREWRKIGELRAA